MLQTIREYTQGWIATIIISIIILTFALWGVHSYFQGGSSNNEVASVNGADITKDQLQAAYERMRRQIQSQYGTNLPPAVKNENVLKRQALQALIDIEVLKQASYTQGFRIYDAQIDNYLQSMSEFQVDGQFSVDRFHEVLSSSLLSTSEFLDLIRTSLLIDQPKLGIVFSSFSLPKETDDTISLVNQERDLAYILIPTQYTLSNIAPVSAEKIARYYQEHQKDFMTKDQVSVDYLELSLKDISNKIEPTEAMLKKSYEENLNSYTKPMQWKFSTLEIPIVNPKDLAASKQKAEQLAEAIKKSRNPNDLIKVAQSYSAKLTNHELTTSSQLPVNLQKEMLSLTTAGQVSAPIETPNGFVIIKVYDIQNPKIESFAAAKDKVKIAYIRQHAEEQFADLREQLANLTYEHPDSLQAAAQSLNLPIKSTELFAKDSGKGIASHKKIREVAFSNDVLGLQNNSDAIQLDSETAIVLRIKSHVKPKLLVLDDVKNQIEQKLKTQEAEAKLVSFATALKTELQAGKNPQQLAQSNHLNWTEVGFIGRYSTKLDPAILDAAFRLPNPNGNHNQPIYDIARLSNGSYAVLSLKSVKPGMNDPKQFAVFSEQLQNSEGILEYTLYKQSQVANAKIKIME